MEGAGKSVTLRLDRFGRDALDQYVRGGSGSRALALRTAARYYLSDAQSGRAAWKVPKLLRDAPSGEPLEVEVDDESRAGLEREARRQEVSIDLLAQHAVTYFLTDHATGRTAARLGAAIARDAEAD